MGCSRQAARRLGAGGCFSAVSALAGDGKARFLSIWGEQPSRNRGVRPLSLRIIIGEAAGLEDDRAQLGAAAATPVVEVHER